jgi:hypothetical protein
MLRVVQGRRGQRVRPRDHARAHALPMEAPTEILNDNAANLSVGNNIGQASASRHFLRRYGVLVRAGRGTCARYVRGPPFEVFVWSVCV